MISLLRVAREGAKVICETHEGAAMGHWIKESKNAKGQNIVEYAIVAALVSAAMFAMSTYVFRSVQATQQMIEKEMTRN